MRTRPRYFTDRDGDVLTLEPRSPQDLHFHIRQAVGTGCYEAELDMLKPEVRRLRNSLNTFLGE